MPQSIDCYEYRVAEIDVTSQFDPRLDYSHKIRNLQKLKNPVKCVTLEEVEFVLAGITLAAPKSFEVVRIKFPKHFDELVKQNKTQESAAKDVRELFHNLAEDLASIFRKFK